MKNKRKTYLYLISTTLLTIVVLLTVANSIFNEAFLTRFTRLGYPSYLIAPIMTAKVLGLIAIWSNKLGFLKEWAYAGFCFLFVLAFITEFHAVDMDYISPFLALLLLWTSYWFSKKNLPSFVT